MYIAVLCSLFWLGISRPAHAQRRPLLQAPLSCPACACARATRELEANRQELNELKPLVRTRGPDIMTLAGGVGTVLPIGAMLLTGLAFAYVGRGVDEDSWRQAWRAAVVVSGLHFGALLSGLIWRRTLRVKQVPALHRFHMLKEQSKTLRIYTRDVCMPAVMTSPTKS